MNRKIDLSALSRSFDTIATQRGWSQLHTPKNLACALSVETGELLAHFQWCDAGVGEFQPEREKVASEMADVLLYLNALANALEIDLVDAVAKKCRHNEERFGSTHA